MGLSNSRNPRQPDGLDHKYLIDSMKMRADRIFFVYVISPSIDRQRASNPLDPDTSFSLIKQHIYEIFFTSDE